MNPALDVCDDDRALRLAVGYFERVMPDAGAEEVEAMALKFLAALQGTD